jgi:polar amino acid transport system permease protein
LSYGWDFNAISGYTSVFLHGALYTLGFTVLTCVLGAMIGVGTAIMALAPTRFVTIPVKLYVGLFRCSPVLVQLIWFYYAFPELVGISMSPAGAALLTLSLYSGAFFSEIFRGGILAVDKGQWDGARALGMRRGAVMRRIVLPQALRTMTPPLINQIILNLKNTSLVSVLAVPDLLYQSQAITAATYRPLEVYTITAVIYVVLLAPLTAVVEHLERRIAATK